ncbi:transglutaminase-like enzyme, predicted cysteine protease [Halalkaliarchaeum desulfuricum]|uniref:Transglutaminase-like enzyme, predicted cysteine protease n=1 Tax=Halalkaliarchaeum desulfuricum TaxID=2055893 RepID=A0A343THB2_9EURY|nr:transglutaminase domain-containing protein [Halalkaliarchaeum desulfuricum]AUX08484.1 transglutaminase-like enzyme, predicted cysteine protease [Halalkaliarchaeum desulfuricum]
MKSPIADLVRRVRRRLARAVDVVFDPQPFSVEPPLVGVLVVLSAALWEFYGVVDVVGGVGQFALTVAVTIVLAVGAARTISPRAGMWIGSGLLAVGSAVYLLAVPASQRALFTLPQLVFDTVSLLSGLSVLRLAEPTAWVLSMAPVPTFLAVYAGLRGRYTLALVAPGGALGFFVLTGDAGTAVTLVGALGVALALGLDTLSVPGGVDTHRRTLGAVLLAMLLVTSTLTVVPGGAAGPFVMDRGTSGLESTLSADEEELAIVGSVRLSQEVRFTVESDEPAQWRTGIYDEYTGDGWARTGETTLYDGEIDGPPGSSERITQLVTARTEMGVFPAAAQPVAIEGPAAQNAQVTELGSVHPSVTIMDGETVRIESERLRSEPDELRNASTEYPEEIEARYTDLPESTPDRVGDLTADVIDEADADNPYDAAVAIERYLEENKQYSLTVERPSGDVADAFLFEMDAGYCTYYATTMTAMLRSQDVPARFVTGYTTGERIGENEWAVRGQNAHAWVEVYVPEHGWVEFDPTPSDPRDSVRDARLVEARQGGVEGVDVEGSGPGEWTPDDDIDDETDDPVDTDPEDDPEVDDVLDPDAADDPADAGDVQPVSGVDQREFEDVGAAPGLDDPGEEERTLPSRDSVGYGALLLFGFAVAIRQRGWDRRAYRAVWLRYPGRRRDPGSDVQRAFARLEYLLGRRYRPRRPTETPRTYLTAMQLRGADERIEDVYDAYERAQYSGEVSRADADAAIETVDDLVWEATPVVRRFRE